MGLVRFVFALSLVVTTSAWAGGGQRLFCGCDKPYCTPMDGHGHYCTGGDEFCCDDNFQFTCMTDVKACSGIPLFCAGSSDCPGQVCCALPDPSAFVSMSICKDYCGMSSDDPEGFRLCTSDLDCVDLGVSCKPSGGLVPFHRCRY